MKLQFSIVILAGPIALGSVTAQANPIEVTPETGTGDIGVIRVDGPDERRYTEVKNDQIVMAVSVRGTRPRRARGDATYTMIRAGFTDKTGLLATGPLTTQWVKIRIAFDYYHPKLPREYANVAVTPVDFCNQQLQNRTGQARRNFLRNGSRTLIQDAYAIRTVAGYNIRRVLLKPTAFATTTTVPVRIRCMPLDRARARETSTTSTERGRDRAREQARESAGQRPPQRTPPPPVTRATLRIEPSNAENINGQLCPTRVRLIGTVSANRAFTGKAAFVGAGFLSPIQDVNFARAGNRTLRATADIDWSSDRGLAANSGTASARRKTLTFRFNVSDADGQLARSAQATRTVTCAVSAAQRNR